jgi:hypothetical protein
VDAGLEESRGFVGSRSMLGDEAMPAAAIGADVFIQNVHLVLNSKYAEGLQQRCGLCLCSGGPKAAGLYPWATSQTRGHSPFVR